MRHDDQRQAVRETGAGSFSAVVHFFESLEHYCERGLLDEALAVQLFGRAFEIVVPADCWACSKWTRAQCGTRHG